ncbi:hypothetical protein HB779_06840 [Phyllobacterium sp. 628]|uniref:hypothetical protein n=1 Tax=Phyllobacterium sp. 628 TaxID=2718938 RepID=UPI00166264E2|nr:hypothetical protein [Phyllobacterium sp. 628]QND51645.1 hypothetical protein HB779_06840 [Phyllobacterium sp. 628]
MMRRVVNILAVIVSVALLYAMQQTKPHYEDLTGPIAVYGKMHDRVHTRQFDVTVQRVDFTPVLTFTQYGQNKTLTTSGLWAVVTAELAATTDTTTVLAATWRGPSGLQFRRSDRVGMVASQQPPVLGPGIPAQVRLVFEIPSDQVNGATLLLSKQSSPRLDSEARIAIDDYKKFNDGQPLTSDSYDLTKPVLVSGN